MEADRSAATTEPRGAWAKPLAARKLHFFRDGYTSALCGAYMTMQVKPSDFAEGTLAVEGYIAIDPCPMTWALERGREFDAFVVLTDSETWAGPIHPKQALDRYRQRVVGDARCAVVGMVSNGFSIADPRDRGMLDVVGFDTATPTVLSEFIAGRF